LTMGYPFQSAGCMGHLDGPPRRIFSHSDKMEYIALHKNVK
jgi:hypothetical protein